MPALEFTIFVAVIFFVPQYISAQTLENCEERNDAAALAVNHSCARPCKNNGGVYQCRSSKKCVCDGLCGRSCIITAANLCPLPVSDGLIVDVDNVNMTFGTTAAYSCYVGYHLQGPSTTVCRGDGTWSGQSPTCVREAIESNCEKDNLEVQFQRRSCLISCLDDSTCKGNRICLCNDICGLNCIRYRYDALCPELLASDFEYIESITYNPNRLSFRTIATFTCQANFRMEGSGTQRCLGAGLWSDEVINCVPEATCPEPPMVDLADYAEENFYLPGRRITYTCDFGYYKKGLIYIQCLSNLTWTEVQFECLPKSCGDPGTPSNGQRIASTFSFLDRVRYECNEGYRLVGDSYRVCQADQAWSNTLPICQIKSCGHPGTPGNCHLIGSSFSYEDRVEFVCNCESGYRINGATHSVCQANETWSNPLPECVVQSCGDPETPENGKREGSDFSYLNRVQYTCNDGYRLVGKPDRVCQADGIWSNQLPECEIKHCENPGTPKNGTRIGSSFLYLDRVEYVCNCGYRINGAAHSVCQANETWSNPLPECVETYPCVVPKCNGTIFRQHNDMTINPLTCIPKDEKVYMTCTEGYIFPAADTCTCRSFGQFRDGDSYSAECKMCEPDVCKLGVDEHLEMTVGDIVVEGGTTISHNDQVSFKCSRGFRLQPNNEKLLCLFGNFTTLIGSRKASFPKCVIK